MRGSEPKADAAFVPLSFPCPQCGDRMTLKAIERNVPHHDQRTFQCQDCGFAETLVARLASDADISREPHASALALVTGGTTMPAILDNSAHWRARANESRVIAAQLQDPESRRMMLMVAESYERLAEHADQRRIEKEHVPLVPDRYK